MTKLEFLAALRERLSGLPLEDIEKSVEYYSEMIEDRMEDGVAEEAAVEAIGSVDGIAAGILADSSSPKPAKTRGNQKRQRKTWKIVLLVLGSPVWLPLLLAAAIILLSVYIVLWSVVVVFYAAAVTLGAAAVAGVFGMISLGISGGIAQGLLFLGAGLLCAGLAILWFQLSNLTAKGVLLLGKRMFVGIKRRFIGKETA